MVIKSKIWFEIDGKPFIGAGRIKLLMAIDQTGSITEAAKSVEMSYKKAWKLIHSMNELSAQPLVLKTTGGKGGGGTMLTPYAHQVIKTYIDCKSEIHQKIDEVSVHLSDI
jgi:molybdate transport system regulatory protein